METFFATLKTECATQPFATRIQAHTAFFRGKINVYLIGEEKEFSNLQSY
jgi:hypothetical protein